MRREKKKTTKMEEKIEFEFCKVCKINHNQGRRHNFFPRHTNSLSSLFARFHKKLSVVKSYLKNPSFGNSSNYQGSSNRIWCIFCETDIDELGSSFTSGNAIKHLASDDHLKNLKHFLWKYGGGMDKVDSFRITEDELAKWEKRCKVLKSEGAASSKRFYQPVHGQSNDIQPNYGIMNSFDKNNMHFLESNLSKDVMPLQYDTNENCQVYHTDISKVDGVSPFQQAVASPTPMGSQHDLNYWNSTFMSHSQHPLFSAGTNFLANGFVSAGGNKNQSMTNRGPIAEASQNVAQISSGRLEDVKGNVHSGAPPPWLEGIEAHGNSGLSRELGGNTAHNNSKKTSKLNPNRVGAAWAERRKLEMEMEKRGEFVLKDSDADWLPNFGRVWQSGTRKESMKEFKKEKLRPAAESQAEADVKLQPYISKRMRRDKDEASSEVVQSSDIS